MYSTVQGYEVVALISVKFACKYYSIVHRAGNGTMEWIMVVGKGFHTHHKPGRRPDPKFVKNLVEEKIEENCSSSRGDIYKEVVWQHV